MGFQAHTARQAEAPRTAQRSQDRNNCLKRLLMLLRMLLYLLPKPEPADHCHFVAIIATATGFPLSIHRRGSENSSETAVRDLELEYCLVSCFSMGI